MVISNKQKYKTTIYHIPVMVDDGAGSGSSSDLIVDTDKLASYGSYLVTTGGELSALMDALNTAMGTIKDGWGDEAGAALIADFNSFITDAKNISTKMATAGTFAQGEAAKYDTILSASLAMMNGGE